MEKEIDVIEICFEYEILIEVDGHFVQVSRFGSSCIQHSGSDISVLFN